MQRRIPAAALCALLALPTAALSEPSPTATPTPAVTPAVPSFAEAYAAAIASLSEEEYASISAALEALQGVVSPSEEPLVAFRDGETGMLLVPTESGTPRLYCMQDHAGVTCTCGMTSSGQTLTVGGETFEIWLDKSASRSKRFVDADSINVRTGPGTDYEKKYVMTRDAAGYVLATVDGWSLIVYGETNVGFVDSHLLSAKPDASKSPPPVEDEEEEEPAPGGRPGGGRR